MSLADIVVDSLRNGGVAAPNGSIVRIASAGTVVVAQANSAPNYAGLVGVIRSTGSIAPGGALNIVNVGTTEVLLETGLTPTNGADLYLSATVAGRATTTANSVRIGVVRNTSRYAAESLVSATVTSLGAGGGGGSQGSQGAPGATGATGSQGSPGTPGATGSQGSPGAPGSTGLQGSPGTPGSTGSQGSPGTPGATGSQGSPGTPGSTGLQGSPGTPGSTGSQGSPGTPGATGSQGSPGTPGSTGLQGSPGTPGSTGSQGSPGTPGATGSQGAQGAQNFIVLNVDTTATSNTGVGVQTLRTYTVGAGVVANNGDMVHARYTLEFVTVGDNAQSYFLLSLDGLVVWQSQYPNNDGARGDRWPRTPHKMILDVQVIRRTNTTAEVTVWCTDSTNEIGQTYGFSEVVGTNALAFNFTTTGLNLLLQGGDPTTVGGVKYNVSFVHLYKV